MNHNINTGTRPRALTSELIDYAKKRSEFSMSSAVFLFPVVLIFCTAALSVDLMFLSSLMFDMFSGKGIPAGFKIYGMAVNMPVAILLIYLFVKKRMLFGRYCFVLSNGVVTDARIVGIDLECDAQLDDAPRAVLDIDLKGRRIRVKSFTDEILDYCRGGSSVPVIWHCDMPDIIIPVESLRQKLKELEPEIFVASINFTNSI